LRLHKKLLVFTLKRCKITLYQTLHMIWFYITLIKFQFSVNLFLIFLISWGKNIFFFLSFSNKNASRKQLVFPDKNLKIIMPINYRGGGKFRQQTRAFDIRQPNIIYFGGKKIEFCFFLITEHSKRDLEFLETLMIKTQFKCKRDAIVLWTVRKSD
jgi:hypothetical protein